eukprot:6491364-Amphidinium_carterae.3
MLWVIRLSTQGEAEKEEPLIAPLETAEEEPPGMVETAPTGEEVESLTAKAPYVKDPSKEERESHNLTHLPYKP